MENTAICDDFSVRLWVPETPPFVVHRIADEHTLCRMWEQGAVLVLLKTNIGEAAKWAETLNCPLF